MTSEELSLLSFFLYVLTSVEIRCGSVYKTLVQSINLPKKINWGLVFFLILSSLHTRLKALQLVLGIGQEFTIDNQKASID